MEISLYPLKFFPIFKERIWAGDKLFELLEKEVPTSMRAGESWEISGVEGDVSIVSEGHLAGNSLQELAEVYMGDLLGDSVYGFWNGFPLLIKFIDAAEALSVQVHPNDQLAKERHNSFGKTEMWYVVDAEPGSELISGFNCLLTKESYRKHVEEGTLVSVLHSEPVTKGDLFFMPAGRVHAIGAGVLVAEIQQTSDITYRIFDWNRVDETGKGRKLHTEEALDAIDFSAVGNARTLYEMVPNQPATAVDCPYFTTRVITCDRPVPCDFTEIDSFVIYICTDGLMRFDLPGQHPVILFPGETLLMPALLKKWTLVPSPSATCLEVYIHKTFYDADQKAEFLKSSPTLKDCPAPVLPEFAFIGRSNVGKSSLINMLAGRGPLAKTSSTPGKTRYINHFTIDDLWYLVDLPGYGYARVSKRERETFSAAILEYVAKRNSLHCLFVLLDGRLEPQKIDLQFVNWAGELGVPMALILQNPDKISQAEIHKNQKAFFNRMMESWMLYPRFTSSAEKGRGREEILEFIANSMADRTK